MANPELGFGSSKTQEVRDFLARSPRHYQAFRDFFALYCAINSVPKASDPDDHPWHYEDLLSRGLGEKSSLIFATRQSDDDPSHPDSYLLARFNPRDATTTRHPVLRVSHTGAGDRFERTLHTARFELCLSGSGSYVQRNKQREGLADILLLPHQIEYRIAQSALTLATIHEAA